MTAIFLLGACGGGKNESDTDASDAGTTGSSTGAGTDPTDATDATNGMSSTPTTGEPGSTSANPTTTTSEPGTISTSDTEGSATTSSASDTDGTTGSAETTGGGDDLMALCEQLCAKNDECKVGGPPDCVQQCVADLGDQEEGACKDASDDLLTCVTTMTCDEFVAFMEDEDPGPCAAQLKAQSEACSDEVCSAGAGGNMEGTECSYTVDCPNKPTLEMQCDVTSCTCLEDGKEVSTCDAEAVCKDIGGLEAKAQGCCGF